MLYIPIQPLTIITRRSRHIVTYICRKIWGIVVSQVKPSNCFRFHPTSMISKHSAISVAGNLSAPRKINITFHFLTQVFHPWWCETCRVIQKRFWMKECDILGWSKHSDPSYIFSGVLDIGVGAVGTRDRSPTFRTGIIPHFLWCSGNGSTKTCSELHNFSTKLIFFLGASTQTPNWGGHNPSQTPPLHSSQYFYPPTFNLTPTPLVQDPNPRIYARMIAAEMQTTKSHLYVSLKPAFSVSDVTAQLSPI